ncbi:MAG: hypothetical protein ABIV25_07095 [Paracoccaceae bacterium]
MMIFRPTRLIQSLMLMAGLGLLAACDGTSSLQNPPIPLGNFALGLNIVVPETAQTVPISRKATDEEWKTAMTKAIADRFGRYDGTKLYNLGISIDGYELAPPGVPIVASPRSAVIFTVNIWDDASQTQLNPGGKRLTVIEGISPESVIGSGWTQNKQTQLDKMSYKAALAVQNYLLDNPEWFGMPPKGTPAVVPAAVVPPTAVPATVAPTQPAPPVIKLPKRPSGQIP